MAEAIDVLEGCYARVSDWVRRSNYTLHRLIKPGAAHKNFHTPEKILDLFQQGFGYCAVAKILGLNESTIKTYSLLYRSGDETSWVNSKAQKTNPQVLFAAVTEYLQSKYGYKQLAIKYGLRSSTIARGVKNYLKHGIVILPRGRNAMKRLQEQKAKLQQRIQQQDKQPLSKKECREMRDLLEVNIALLEVLEESDPDELKKKNTGSKESGFRHG